uniref:SH2 domain-containing protein n=1 Tax=Hippocampus comes TaxID=109280 RepID=A0A3Q2XVP0_HIPCM
MYPTSDGYFQQDNAPCHKAGIFSDWFLEHDNEFTVLKWTPQSPDLNPIEHLWDVVEREIRIMDVQPTNLRPLCDAIMSIWTKLSEECFQQLFESMPRRIEDSEVYEKPWFAGECDRKTAEELLFHANQDGAFMVRKSSRQDTNQPYTLVVYYKGRVYNIPIRLIHMHTRQQYALGREKKGEEYFHSVSHIIENHQKNPLVLIDSKSNSKDSARLRFPVKQPTTSGHHCQASNAF